MLLEPLIIVESTSMMVLEPLGAGGCGFGRQGGPRRRKTAGCGLPWPRPGDRRGRRGRRGAVSQTADGAVWAGPWWRCKAGRAVVAGRAVAAALDACCVFLFDCK